MKRAALLLAIGLAALAARASDEPWLLVATGDDLEYHGQRGSALVTDRTVSFVLRQRRIDRTGSAEISRAIVKREDCARQSGTLVIADLAMDRVRMRVDFAFSAGTVGSVIAERVCNELRADRPSKSQGVTL